MPDGTECGGRNQDDWAYRRAAREWHTGQAPVQYVVVRSRAAPPVPWHPTPPRSPGGSSRRDPDTRFEPRCARPSTVPGRGRSRAGALPALPDDVARPAVDVERPADPSHGDFATQPGDEAGPAVSDGAARDRRHRSPTQLTREASDDPAATPIATVDVAGARVPQHPAWPTGRSRRPSRRSSPSRTAGGASRRSAAARSTSSSCRPTRPVRCTSAMPAARSSATCSAGCSRPAGSSVTREYYFNDSGGQIRNLGASVAALRRGDPVPDDGYKGDYVADLVAALPDDVWAGRHRGRTPTRTGSSATGPPVGSARASSAAWPPWASASTSGRARPGSTTRAGSTGRSSGSASTATSTSRTARSGSARPTSATTRTG